MQKNKKVLYLSLGALFLSTAYMLSKKWKKPIEAKITSKFGYRIHPITHKSILHNGIDLHAPIGTAIKAPYGGIVESVYSNDAGGLQLILKHTNGFRTGYAHLSKVNYAIGTKIRKGQIIALTGNSGQVTAPHLHFTLTNPSGEKVDPQKFIYTS